MLVRGTLLAAIERTYLSPLPQSFGLFAVDVALHAGLTSVDESGVPQGESTQSYCHCAAGEGRGTLQLDLPEECFSFMRGYCSPGQHPEEDDTLVSSAFFEAVVWRRGLVVTLKQTQISC